MNLRAAVKEQFRQREGVALSPLPFIVRAVAMTLPRHPVLNSTLDVESGEATYKRPINLKPDEISGGTFTVTNTGSMGTMLDTPILNPPEVGILGAAAVEKRPVVVSDEHGDSIAIRWMMYGCLS